MGEVVLKPGWFARDVFKAVQEKRCYEMVRKLNTEELREWHANAVAILKRRAENVSGPTEKK